MTAVRNAPNYHALKAEYKAVREAYDKSVNRLAIGAYEVGLMWKKPKIREWIRDNRQEAAEIVPTCFSRSV